MSQIDEMKKGIDDLAKDAVEMKKLIDDHAKDFLEMKKWIDDLAKDSLEKTDALEAQINKLNTYLLPPATAADAADAAVRPTRQGPLRRPLGRGEGCQIVRAADGPRGGCLGAIPRPLEDP